MLAGDGDGIVQIREASNFDLKSGAMAITTSLTLVTRNNLQPLEDDEKSTPLTQFVQTNT
jgi:hypothetical protein